MIDYLCINPISYPADRINTQVIYGFALAQMECTINVLVNNCKQNISSLSLLVGTTVEQDIVYIFKFPESFGAIILDMYMR